MAQQRASNGAGSAARHVEQIVEAAERAAEELRAAAEARANERIAEAERAARAARAAADEEAADVRAAAEAEAREALPRPRPPRESWRGGRREAREAGRARGGGQGRRRARELIYEARAATREVLRDGETISGHLRELSDSLRANAERLLIDIRAAHAEMTARLDRVDPDLGAVRGPPGPPPRRQRLGRRTRDPRVHPAPPALSGSVRHTN